MLLPKSKKLIIQWLLLIDELEPIGNEITDKPVQTINVVQINPGEAEMIHCPAKLFSELLTSLLPLFRSRHFLGVRSSIAACSLIHSVMSA